MRTCFGYRAFFQHHNSICVHDGGKAMGDQDSDMLLAADICRTVSVITSSVRESSAEVASSKINSFG